jgi:hypothetical protein
MIAYLISKVNGTIKFSYKRWEYGNGKETAKRQLACLAYVGVGEMGSAGTYFTAPTRKKRSFCAQ